MPQLDISTYPGQLLWLLITFVVLFFILRRVALPRIADVLEARQDKIDDDLKKAASLKEEADAVMAEYDAALAEARANAHETLRSAQESWQAEADKQSEALNARLLEQTREAESRIAAAKNEALQNLSDAVVEVASSATARLLGAPVPEGQVKKTVDEVMGSKG